MVNILQERKLDKNALLSLKINLHWSAELFSMLFDRIDKLYDFYSEIMILEALIDEEESRQYAENAHKPSSHFTFKSDILLDTLGLRYFPKNTRVRGSSYYIKIPSSQSFGVEIIHQLIVKKISFASPGSIDLLGIAGVLEQIKDILFSYFPGKEKQKNILILEEQRVKLRINNLKAMGFTEIEIKKILLQEEVYIAEIKELIDNGRITSLDYLEN